MRSQHPWRAVVALTGIAGLAAVASCADQSSDPAGTAPSSEARTTGGGPNFRFTGLAASQICTVAGGSPTAPFLLPAGFSQTILASEPSYADVPDMNTQNEDGPDAGRYLYQT